MIKRDFTSRRNLSVKSALSRIESIILYYSNNDVDFALVPTIDSKILKAAQNIATVNFKSKTNNTVEYKGTKSKHLKRKELQL